MPNLTVLVEKPNNLDPVYCGLIKAHPVFSENDTAANHPGWQEFTSYKNGFRPKVNGITKKVTFEIATDGFVGGIFLTSEPKYLSANGVLYAEGFLSSESIEVLAGDTFTIKLDFHTTGIITAG